LEAVELEFVVAWQIEFEYSGPSHFRFEFSATSLFEFSVTSNFAVSGLPSSFASRCSVGSVVAGVEYKERGEGGAPPEPGLTVVPPDLARPWTERGGGDDSDAVLGEDDAGVACV
jgi:hypothetical protein